MPHFFEAPSTSSGLVHKCTLFYGYHNRNTKICASAAERTQTVSHNSFRLHLQATVKSVKQLFTFERTLWPLTRTITYGAVGSSWWNRFGGGRELRTSPGGSTESLIAIMETVPSETEMTPHTRRTSLLTASYTAWTRQSAVLTMAASTDKQLTLEWHV